KKSSIAGTANPRERVRVAGGSSLGCGARSDREPVGERAPARSDQIHLLLVDGVVEHDRVQVQDLEPRLAATALDDVADLGEISDLEVLFAVRAGSHHRTT